MALEAVFDKIFCCMRAQHFWRVPVYRDTEVEIRKLNRTGHFGCERSEQDEPRARSAQNEFLQLGVWGRCKPPSGAGAEPWKMFDFRALFTSKWLF